MAEALADELEAINSIYGEGSLVSSTDSSAASSPEDGKIYIIQLPDITAVSLRLQFPPTYPDVPPAVLGTHSTGGLERGAAARHLALFRDALAAVYEPGQVCLFDAVEAWKEALESAGAADKSGIDQEATPDDNAHTSPSSLPNRQPDQSSSLALSPSLTDPSPPWTLSDPVIELKSTFIARCAPVTSPAQARSFVAHLLATDKRVANATHNMTAWRIRGSASSSSSSSSAGQVSTATAYQDCDDGGETAAGGRLLHLMQLMDLWDVMVIVTRWYGGQKLGPRRFALINAAARDAFVKAGLVGDGTGGAAGGGGKKKGHGK